MSAVPDTTLGRRTIAEILLEHGHLSKEQADEAHAIHAETGRPLGQILVEAGTITRLELASALAEQWSDSGAPIAPPAGMALSGSPALQVFEPSALLAGPVVSDPDLVSRVEAVEEALERLAETTEDDDQGTLQARIETISERVDALAEAAAGEDSSAELRDLRDGLETAAQLADSAFRRTDDVAGTASAGVERVAREVAELTQKLAGFAAGEDVERLRESVEALGERPDRDPVLAAQIEDLQAVVESLAERSTRDPALVGQIEDLQAVVEALAERPVRDAELGAQVDTLAQHLSELGERLDVVGGAVQSLAGDADAIHQVESALAELAQRPLIDSTAELRLDEMTRQLEELSQRPVADPAAGQRVEERVEELAVALADLRSTTRALAERPAGDPALDERLFELTTRLALLEESETLSQLRVQVTELAERPVVDPAILGRLAELEGKIDALPGDELANRVDANERGLAQRIDSAVARIDEVAVDIEQMAETSVSREAWNEAVALVNSRIEVERELGERLAQLEQQIAEVASREGTAKAVGKAGAADPKLVEQVAALSQRVDQLAAGVVPTGDNGSGEAASVASHSNLERDVEHVLMAIERLSVHLGAHERALTDLMGSHGLAAQVRELGARVGDIETYGGGGGSAGEGGGDPQVRTELRGLMRRLEDAETAQKKDRDRVIEQLEKAAGAIDWRLQRLETPPADEPTE